MSVNFLTSVCNEASRKEEIFGLCDDQNGTVAYSTVTNAEKWVATVINNNAVDVVFTPIDFCVIVYKPNGIDRESTCDGMLSTTDCLYLIELKDRATGGWRTRAIEQLISTINLLRKDHDLTRFKYKKAFPCNRSFPSFKVIDNEENLKFFRSYGFRLDSNSTIDIK